MTADRMPVEHQMLDAAGAPGAWPTHLLVDRLSAVLGDLDRYRAALEEAAAYRHTRDHVRSIAQTALRPAITDAQEGTA